MSDREHAAIGFVIVCGILGAIAFLAHMSPDRQALNTPTIKFGAPVATLQRSILPETTGIYDLGTSSRKWSQIWTNSFTIATTTTGCAQNNGIGQIIFTGSNCGTGAGGGGSGVATTSLLATFPNIVTKTTASITFSNAFSTTTDTGLTSNRFVVVNAGGILGTVASSGLALPNTALQNSSFLTSFTNSTLTGDSSVNLGGTFTIGVNLTNANTWTGLQKFSGTGTTSVANGFYASLVAAPYFNATSTTASSTFQGIEATAIDLTGTATSTGVNGFNITSGCFSQQGVCLDTLVSSQGTTKAAVTYASTTTLPANTYSNGTNGVGATLTGVANGPFYLDGNSPGLNTRVLVKNEAAGADNGIYTLTTVGVIGLTPYVLTRATDYNSSTDVFPGVGTFVNSGTVNALTCWVLSNATAVVIGTTALTYDDTCGTGSFSGQYPIIVTGTTISTAFGTSTQWTTGQVAYVNANGNVSSTATTTLAGGGPITVSNSPVVIGASGAVLGCTTATASVAGCLAAADFTTFNGKLNFSNLFNNQPSYNGQTTISTSTSLWLTLAMPGKYALVASSSFITYASSTVASATTLFSTTATTSSLGITGLSNVLLFASSGGGVIGSSTLSVSFGGTGLSTGGTPGQVLMWSGVTGAPVWLATSTVPAGSASSTLKQDLNQYTGLNTFNGGILVNTSSSTFAGMGTTTFSGVVDITGNAGTTLGAYQHAYLHIGSTTCPTNPTFFGYLEVCGTDNTANGVQIQLGNKSAGTSAFTGISFLNNRSDTNLTNYAGVYYNSDTYSDTTFGTAFAVASQAQLVNVSGPIIISSASSTGGVANSYINFDTGGGATANEMARMTADANMEIGTTTPNFSLLTLASSTKPQLGLCDKTATNFCWTERAIGNSFSLSTSTAIATSTSAALAIDITGKFSFYGGGLAIGSGGTASTTLSGILAGNGVNMVNSAQLSAAFGFANNTLTNTIPHGFDFSTTTPFTGTTTLHYTVTQTGTIVDFMCKIFQYGASPNFLNVQLGTGSASTTMAIASTTQGIVSSSLSVTANTTLFIDMGATSTASFGSGASTTKDVSCSWDQKT